MPHQMLSNSCPTSGNTHYEVLGLPVAVAVGRELQAQHIKAAYRRALLQHHPDKSRTTTGDAHRPVHTGNSTTYTVDQIAEAYAVLSVPRLRSEYDRELKLRYATVNDLGHGEQAFRTGFETVDLEDLTYDEEDEVWYRSCRCGDERGFLVREADLEEAVEEAELHVGCRGCSLWLKVLFGVLEEDISEEPVNGKGNG